MSPVMTWLSNRSKRNLAGQVSLFDNLDEGGRHAASRPGDPGEPAHRAAGREKETTGLYISGHPMDQYRKALRRTSAAPIERVTGEDALRSWGRSPRRESSI